MESIAKIDIWDLQNIDNHREDQVIREQIVTIQITELGSFTLLCTPTNLEELAYGFMFTEGLIETKDDVMSMSGYDSSESVISLKIKNPERVKTKRNLIVTSGCGFCGKDNIETIISSIPIAKNSLSFAANKVEALEKNIRQKQIIFNVTGGAHSAAFFNSDGEIIAMQEDVGRHNALDKTIGYCIKNNIDSNGLGLFLSSRISFEMVTKAARAGIEIIIGVSAPTDLAIKASNYWNITLCGFARNGKGNIYTSKERIA